MSGKLDLYWAKSLADLNSQSEIPPGTTKNPRLLVKTASKLYKTAEDHQQLGNEEKAYVMYMKFINVFHLMRSSPDYRKEKKYYDDLLGVSPVKALESAENLSNSLKTRYEEKEAAAAAAKLENTHVTGLVNDVTKSKSTATFDYVTFSDTSSDTDSNPAYIPASVSEKPIVPSCQSGPNTQTVPSAKGLAIDRSVQPNVSQQKAQPAIAPVPADIPVALVQKLQKDSLNQPVARVQLPAEKALANGSIPGTNQTKMKAYPQVDQAIKHSAQAKISDSQYEKEQALSERLSAQNKRIINETSSKLQELNSQRAQLEQLELMKQKDSKAVMDLMRMKRRLEEDIKSQEQRLDSAKKVQLEHDALPYVDRTKKPQKSVEDWKRSLNALEGRSSSDSDSDDYDFTALRKAHATERNSRGDRASSLVSVSPAGGLKSISTKSGLSTPEQQGVVLPSKKSSEALPNGMEEMKLVRLNKERAKEKVLEEEAKKERERIENQKRQVLARGRQEEESRKELERAEALKIQEMERMRKEEAAKKESERAKAFRFQELERSRLEEELRKEHEKNEALKMLEVERKKQLEEARIKCEKAEALKQQEAEKARLEEEARKEHEKNEALKMLEVERKKQLEEARIKREKAEALKQQEAERARLVEEARKEHGKNEALKMLEFERKKQLEEARIKCEKAQALKEQEAERARLEEELRKEHEKNEALKMLEIERKKQLEEIRIKHEKEKGTNQTKMEAYPQVDRALKPSAQAKITDSQYGKEQAVSERLSAQNKRMINEASSKFKSKIADGHVPEGFTDYSAKRDGSDKFLCGICYDQQAAVFCVKCQRLLCSLHKKEDDERAYSNGQPVHYHVEVGYFAKTKDLYIRYYCKRHAYKKTTEACSSCISTCCHSCT